MRQVVIVLGIMILAAAVFMGSARASTLLRRPADSSGSANAQQARPASCTAGDIWGMRKAPDGVSYWSCTSSDGSIARFYGAASEALMGTESATLGCGTPGRDGKRDYVECSRVVKPTKPARR